MIEARIGKFGVRDGTQLHYEHWTYPDFKGVIVFVHGVGDHSGRYGPFVNYFTKKGYKVCLFDQRGHGKSPGDRVHVERFETLLDDLDQYVLFSREGIPKECPWYLVGHSLGGQIILNYLARRPSLFHAACASSPNLEVALTMPQWQEKLGRIAGNVWPKMKLTGFVDSVLLSHDSKVVKAFDKDPLVSAFVTIKMGEEILKNIPAVYSLCTVIHTPLLLQHGSADHVCSPEGTKRFFKKLVLAQKELKIYEGMFHELFNEIAKERVFADVHSWFQKFV